MRTLSKARASAKRRADNLRRAFAGSFPACWLCGFPAHDIHEMAAGKDRGVAYGEMATWIRTCRRCHESLQKLPRDQTQLFSVCSQLALKALCDPESYDRSRVLEIKGWADTAVTEREVMLAIRQWVDEYGLQFRRNSRGQGG